MMTPEQIVTEWFGSYEESAEELFPTKMRQRLIERIRAYGAQERQRCEHAVIGSIKTGRVAKDGFYLACMEAVDNATAAIRALR